MTGSTRRAMTLAVLLAVLGGARPARSQTEDDKAESRAHFERAEGHFRAGRYPEALGDYERGYQRAPLPGFLINIAHCHRMMGDLRKARANYRKFLIVQPASPRRTEVEEIIAKLDKAIAEENADRASRASPERWIWSALAAAFVGSTTAAHALATAEGAPKRP